MSVVSGMRRSSTTSTCTFQPSSVRSTPVMPSASRPVRSSSCRAASPAIRNPVGRFGADARGASPRREPLEELVPLDYFLAADFLDADLLALDFLVVDFLADFSVAML